MGYNSTLIIQNDALDQIANDPEFGKKVAEAAGMVSGRVRLSGHDIQAGNHYNAATLVTSHHADVVSVVMVGGNHATVVGQVYNGGNHHCREDQIEVLKNVAALFGLSLVPASVAEPADNGARGQISKPGK